MSSTASSRVNAVRIVVDAIMLLLAALPPIVFKFGNIQPTQRGFFCDEESIRYPYHDGTVSTTALILVGVFTNLIMMIICELVHFAAAKRRGIIKSERKIGPINVHPCLYTICGYFWVLGFGAMVTQSITDIGKWSVGRLRPHFIDGCKPGGGLNLSTCYPLQYVDSVICTQENKEIMKDLRLSFPSGHASLSAFTMVFLALYIQQRVPRFSHSYLFKHVLQFIAILMAWFCAISRVMDNKHHPTDVLAGSIIGTIVALLCAKFIVKGFRNPYTNATYRRVGLHLPRSASQYSVEEGHSSDAANAGNITAKSDV